MPVISLTYAVVAAIHCMKRGKSTERGLSLLSMVVVIANICCSSSNPLHEERENYRERSLTPQHGGGDTCDLCNL